MKTKIILSGLVLTLASVGMGTSTLASANKYADYQTVVESTKSASAAPAPTSTQYNNKYERDLAEKEGLGGTMLSGFENVTGPKNYRNNR